MIEARTIDLAHRTRGMRIAYAAVQTLLSTWTIAVLCTLAVAILVERAIGGAPTRALVVPAGTMVHRVLVYASRAGMLPAVAACGIIVAVWLARRRHVDGAVAVVSSVIVVACFAARPFTAADIIGWRAALAQTLTDGRAVATTGVAIVTAFVLRREGILGTRAAIWLGGGLPVAVGFLRIYLGAHPVGAIVAQWFIGAIIAYGVVRAYVLAARHGERVARAPDSRGA